jgi:hypothetical protein
LRTNPLYFSDSKGLGQTLRHHTANRREYAVKSRAEVAVLKLIEAHRVELEDLCRCHSVSRLELFGSAVVRKRGQDP